MTRYAQGTSVPVERSQAEVISLLRKHGATQTALANTEAGASVLFEIQGRRVRLQMPVPSIADILKGPKPRRVGRYAWWALGDADRAKWAQGRQAQVERQRWRALILVTKAKLELVADGISTIDREFLPDILLPNGRRVIDAMVPALDQAYSTGVMPPLLGDGS